jgi:Holliday junction DNA helicase RuvA
MIATLRGTVLDRTDDGAVVEAAGVGYAVSASAATRDRLPSPGGEVLLHVVESVGMYGGGVSLYGFISAEEKKIFLALKDNVPGAGAKKALELLDKAAKSLPDFRRAVIDKDVKALVTLFGFTAKTAEKLVSGLQDKIDALPIPSSASRDRSPHGTALEEAVQGLLSLGYRDADAREAAQAARRNLGAAATAEALIRDCLRRLSGRA